MNAPFRTRLDFHSSRRHPDVDDIKFVINYDYPNNSEDYVHRIGRTGRREKKGTAYTYFTPQNGAKARDLIKVLEEARQQIPPALYEMQSRGGGGGSGVRGRWANSGQKRNYGDSNGYGGDAKRGRYENGGGRENNGRWA